ncbi:hypothetical protein [Geodermatophilus amargosae]|uniref:hypothetical protein n=1 Tax=Geodermatophilus amargosae TaxID=1296565 RepID=UPI000B858CFC|nr:hypothetical protein [Geodermatophilus amargosae]
MIFTATTVLPNADVDRATAGLRAALRLAVAAGSPSEVPDWSTLVVTGPVVTADAGGWAGSWHKYTGTVGTKKTLH